MNILYFGKRGMSQCESAEAFLRSHGCNVEAYFGIRGDTRPEEHELNSSGYDLVISFCSPWIIPGSILKAARIAALNFHPGPPEYPGIGCTNFAIYNNETTFGIVCHHMAEKVDTGPIVCVKRFPLYPTDSVLSLTQRCYDVMSAAFAEVLGEIISTRRIPAAAATWARRPYRRRELNELCRLTLDMPRAEMARRIRATEFPGAQGAYIELNGFRFNAAPSHSVVPTSPGAAT